MKVFAVVFNDEGAYSVWDTGRALPDGWTREGVTGSREDCLAHIEEIWTDITPKSARRSAGETVA